MRFIIFGIIPAILLLSFGFMKKTASASMVGNSRNKHVNEFSKFGYNINGHYKAKEGNEYGKHEKIGGKNENYMGQNYGTYEHGNRANIRNRIIKKINERDNAVTGWHLKATKLINKIYEILEIVHPLKLLKALQ